MANEKLSRDQWFAWDTTGAAWKDAGFITGGGPTVGPSTTQLRRGINRRRARRAGRQTQGGSVNIDVTSDTYLMFVQGIQSGAGVVPTIEVNGHTGFREYHHENVMIDTFGYAWQLEGQLTANLSWMGMPPEGSGGGAAAPTPTNDLTFELGENAVTWEGASLGLQSFSFTVDNHVHYSDDGDGRATNSKRFPRDILNGDPDVSGSISVLVPPTYDLEADTLSKVLTLQFVATNSLGVALTVTLPDMMFDGAPTEAYITDDESQVVWDANIIQAGGADELITITQV